MMTEKKRPVGRPKLAPGKAFVTVSLRLTQEMLDVIDMQTSARLDRPNRSAVAREVFAEWMGQ